MGRIRVLSPIGVVQSERLTAPPLPDDFTGKTVGFIDNTKHNFDRLADEMGAILRERFGAKAAIRRRKANASTPAPAELIAELAKECDVVFTGSAD